MIYQNCALITMSIALLECAPRAAVPSPRPSSEDRPIASTPEPSRGAKLAPAEAKKRMLTLINRDRAAHGLAPVVLDEGAGGRAAEEHARDMAKLGYLGHWGSDGSVPEQRHTRHGGVDMILENALCFTDEKARPLDPDARFPVEEVENAERLFFDEVPPNDGHRKNILKRYHTRVGIGFAQPMPQPGEIPVACIVQEFLDGYGTYTPVPATLSVGSMLHVEGTLSHGAVVGGVGLARVASPEPIAVSELNRRRSYPVPKPYQMYWPSGFETPIPLQVKGTHFSIDVPISDHGQAGLYEVSVWAKVPGESEWVPVSLRTISVTAR